MLASLPGVEVIVIDGVFNRTAEARANYPSVRTADRLEAVLDDVDAVVVATPPTSHAAIALSALNAGKPVLVEKPLATTVADAELMVETASANHVHLMVGHTFEYNAAVRRLKEIVSSGMLGRVLYIDSARLSLGLYQSDVNVIWDLAPHDISIISYLLDEMPRSAAAWAERHVGNGPHADVAYVRLRFDRSGIDAFVRVSWLSPQKVRRVTVVGERKMATYDDMSDNERIRVYDVGVDPTDLSDTSANHAMPVTYRSGDILSPYIPFSEPLFTQDSHFVECVRTGQPPNTPGERGADVVRVLAATDVALATGQLTPVLGCREPVVLEPRLTGPVAL
ncbi:Gfo/Idh/MocA family protein [Pseudonocardia artemisiae]